jgi:hypothetical protein
VFRQYGLSRGDGEDRCVDVDIKDEHPSIEVLDVHASPNSRVERRLCHMRDDDLLFSRCFVAHVHPSDAVDIATHDDHGPASPVTRGAEARAPEAPSKRAHEPGLNVVIMDRH